MKTLTKKHVVLLGVFFGVLGALLLLRSFAATGTQKFEAEDGQRSGTTALCQQGTASGGDYVKLAQSCTAASPTPTPTTSDKDFTLYLGYGDGNQNGRPAVPDPWKGSPNTIFDGRAGTGCCVSVGEVNGWDGGAIRIQNNTNTNMTAHIEVTEMDYCNRDWNPVTIPAGGNYIVTSSIDVGSQGDPQVWDTSDSDWSCRNTAFTDNCNPIHGRITVTINGQAYSYKDDTGYLSAQHGPNGKDSTCQLSVPAEGAEFTPWTKVMKAPDKQLQVVG